PGQDSRQVSSRVGAKLDARSGSDVEVDIALQMNGAGQERASRNYDSAATRFRASLDGTPERRGAIHHAVADSAVLRHVEIPGRKGRRPDPVFNLGNADPRVISWSRQRRGWTSRMDFRSGEGVGSGPEESRQSRDGCTEAKKRPSELSTANHFGSILSKGPA